MPLSSQLRLFWRRATANPGLMLLSLLTLAVAVGATVALFTVVNAVLLRPLPFPESERLVLLRHAAPQLGPLNDLPMSDALHFLYAEQSRTLDGVVGFSGVAVSFTDPDNPQRVSAASITASFFDVLRPPPLLGRPFTAEEDRPGAAPVVVLGDGLWRSRFGADSGVVGRVVEIDRERVEIVGVMPPGFAFPRPETELWRPMGLDPENVRLGFFGLNGVARIADGASLEQVRAELGAMLSNLEELLPDQPAAPVMAREYRPLIVPVREWTVGDVEATLWILLGAVGFLLLIACANIANLFLVRAEARHGEVAIRAALGESRARLVASAAGRCAEQWESPDRGSAAGRGRGVADVRGAGSVARLLRRDADPTRRGARVRSPGRGKRCAGRHRVAVAGAVALAGRERAGQRDPHGRAAGGRGRGVVPDRRCGG